MVEFLLKQSHRSKTKRKMSANIYLINGEVFMMFYIFLVENFILNNSLIF